jgi:hypothetical protein
MKTTTEKWKSIKNHFNSGGKIVWNDPDPIKDNNYMVSFIEDISEEDIEAYTPILIQYNGGGSEAQVFIHELLID